MCLKQLLEENEFNYFKNRTEITNKFIYLSIIYSFTNSDVSLHIEWRLNLKLNSCAHDVHLRCRDLLSY